MRSQIVLAALLSGLLLTACSRSPQSQRDRHLARAEKQIAKKDFARAILEYRNAIRAVPREADPYYKLALAYVESGDASAAVGALRTATELQPGHARAQLKLAELLAGTRRRELVEQAESRAGQVLAAHPDDPDALETLAAAELRLGKTGPAEEHLRRALARFPRHLKSAKALAGLKIARREWAGAEAVLKSAAAQDPPAVEALVALAEFYFALDRWSDAEPLVRRALELSPRDPSTLLDLAKLSLHTGRPKEAEQALRTVAQLGDPRYRAVHALYLFETGQREAAAAELERLHKENPRDRDVRNRLVAAYQACGRSGPAQDLLTAALKANPRDTDALLDRARIRLSEGQAAEARTDLDQVLRFRPDSAEAHYLLSRVYRRRGAPLSERQELSESIRFRPDYLLARLVLVREPTASHAPQAALDLLEAAPPHQKRSFNWLVERNWALLEAGRYDTLQPVLDRALEKVRAFPLLVQAGALRLARKDADGARKFLEEALEKQPEDLRSLSLLLRAYRLQGRAPAGLARLREYAARRPGSAPLQQFLGETLFLAGDTEGARRAFLAADRAAPGSPPAQLSLARLALHQQHVSEARQIVKNVLSREPLLAPAWMGLAAVEEASGNPAQALQAYRRAVERDGTNALALNNLAFLLADYAHEPDAALRYAQKAKELAPDSPAVEDTLGWVFYRKGIYLTARKHLESAVRQPTADRQYHLAMACWKDGDGNAARAALEAALRLDPAHQAALEARKEWRIEH